MRTAVDQACLNRSRDAERSNAIKGTVVDFRLVDPHIERRNDPFIGRLRSDSFNHSREDT